MQKRGDFDPKFGIPYPSLEAMVADNFDKIGGPLAAAEMVVKTIKQDKWRSDYQNRKKDLERRVSDFLNTEAGRKLEAELKGRK
jgi:hypothetical protein|tara:strand:- start:555 stop:806 length:252 start_codon:yes stop_codon:yes gene_type:complete